MDPDGRPWKVVKYALDVTAEKLRNADYAGKMTAIDRSQMMIEFGLDGTILSANQNFLDLIGYPDEELTGQHHRVLVRPDEANNPEYQQFWERLERGRVRERGVPAGSPRTAARSGSGRPTTRFWTPVAGLPRSSSSPSTSPPRSSAASSCPARWRRSTGPRRWPSSTSGASC